MAKETFYFSHDANARHDPKIQALIYDYGMRGYGLYWSIIEMLRQDDEFKLPKKKRTWNAIAMQMQSKKDNDVDTDFVKTFCIECISEYELFQEDETHFWSQSLMGRMDKMKEKSKVRQKAAAARWGKKEDEPEPQPEQKEPEAKQPESKSNANAEQKKIKDMQKQEELQEEFDLFWLEYPRKVGKKPALKAFTKWRKEYDLEDILKGVKSYAAKCKAEGTETQYIKHPSTFLNEEAFTEVHEIHSRFKPYKSAIKGSIEGLNLDD